MATSPVHPYHQHGTTLLEALVVMALFALGMVGLVQMQSGIASWTEATRLRAEAARLARQKLSELRAQGQAAAALSPTSFSTRVTSSTVDEVFSIDTASFRCRWTVHADGQAKFRKVVVTIAWEDRTGAQALTLPTLIARHPPTSIARLRLPPRHETTTSLDDSGPP